MKNIIKKTAFIFVLSFMIFSCVDEDKFVNPVNFELDNGAFAKFNVLPSTVIDFTNPNEAIFSHTMTDANNNMTHYTLQMTANIGAGTFVVEDLLTFTSFPATVTISAQSIADALGIPITDLNAGDSFGFVATATRDDGVEFNGENASFDPDTQIVGIGETDTTLNAEGGYKSAMKFGFTYVCPVEEGLYIGSYMLENLSETVNGPVFGTGPFLVDIIEVPDTGGVGRSINVNYLADLGIGQDNIDFRFDLICNFVQAAANQGTNLSCGGGAILLGPNGLLPYSPDDDSVIEVEFFDGWEGNDGGCGFPETIIRIRLTRQSE